MTNVSKKTLLTDAHNFLSQENYKGCYDYLSQASPELFIDVVTHNGTGSINIIGPLNSKAANKFFWSNWCIDNPSFLGKLIESKNCFSLFTFYFKKGNKPCIELLVFFARNYPRELVQFIRINEAFLNEKHFSSFRLLEDHSDEYLRIHYQCFVHIREKIASLKNREYELGQQLKDTSFWESLIVGSYYLENTAEKTKDYAFLQLAGGALLNVLKWWVSLKEMQPKVISLSDFERLQLDFFNKWDEQHPVIKALSFVYDYHWYSENYLFHYCYNLNTEPVETKYGTVELDFLDYREHYNWKINSLMYGRIEEEYKLKSAIQMNSTDLLIDREHAALLSMFKDLEINSIPTPNGKFQTEHILSFMQSFISALPVSALPVFSIGKNEIEGFAQSLTNVGEYGDKIVSLFATELNYRKLNKFTPYDTLGSLYYKPIIEIEGSCYVLNVILESYNPFAAIYGTFTQEYERQRMDIIKQENDKLEVAVATKIKNAGIENVAYTKQYSSDSQGNLKGGDIDVCFELNGELYLLELKRTRYRLNDKERWIEKQNSINKAAGQLNRAEKHLRSNTTFLEKDIEGIDTATIPIKKYICTSSPEFRAMIIDGCEVISLQELLLMLNFCNSQGTEAVSTLVNYFKNGWFDVVLPQYQIEVKPECLFFSNQVLADHYCRMFDSGLSLYEKGDLDGAIYTWQQCLEVNGNDATVLGAIANCYADKCDYTNAARMFDKALALKPSDYFILTNRAIASLESGMAVNYFRDLIQVMKIYKTGITLLRNTLNFLITAKRITEQEIAEINLLLDS